jgi:hypothetical protein
MWVRLVSVLCGIVLMGCSFGDLVLETPTSTALPAPATVQVIDATPEPTLTIEPTLTVTPVPIDTTLRVRVIAADAESYAPMVTIIESAALDVGIDVVVDIRSLDGTLTLQQGLFANNDIVDVWIANASDVWQLERLGAISAAPITSDFPTYPFVSQAMRDMAGRGVAPIAAQNYLISIHNTEILTSAPPTTAQLQTMPGLLMRPRYRMAYPWAEGRWFDELMQQLQATTVISDGMQSIDVNASTIAMQTLVDLRALGPREATSYLESTTDFLYSRVPYTLDGDAALRRYQVLSQTLLLDYALPPIISASNTMWLPDIDVVYAAVPESITAERRVQVLQLIQQLQLRQHQDALYEQMRWIPIRNDVLAAKSDDSLARVLDQIGQLAGAQVYDDATICRWDSYEQVLPFALLKVWRINVTVDALRTLIDACPAVNVNP